MRRMGTPRPAVSDFGEVAEWSTKSPGAILDSEAGPEREARRASLTDETSIWAGWGRHAPRCLILERWQSGRMRRIRNPVYGFTVPWVRIPPSPPEKCKRPCWGRLRFWRGLVDEPAC